jgi:hypothetical protein
MDDARAERFGDRHRAVGRTIVGHHDLAGDAEPGKAGLRLLDANAEGVFLVQAGHDGRNVDLAGLGGIVSGIDGNYLDKVEQPS